MSIPHLPFSVPPALEAILRRAYADPPRAYHHFGHVEEVLVHYASAPAFADPASVALAILFHDAVYRPGRKDNEARSAELARELVTGHLPRLAGKLPRIESLILLTARHGTLTPRDVDSDAALFLDCDMAILGAAPARFDEYDRAIRTEYADLPERDYRLRRRAFLQGLLEKKRIFLSDFFHETLDAQARENLRRAVDRLEAADGPSG